ncbi:MAG: glycerophosphoryl diester phosphodiesterase membrane domain-containing protein [Propionibacteriaceae bacterium]|nr:glycerophosphoryl diester phosphodiesterase membrane domain-containing protein [Propionibacteriaceae bacterium]
MQPPFEDDFSDVPSQQPAWYPSTDPAKPPSIDLAQILKVSFRLYKARFKSFMGAAGISVAVMIAICALFTVGTVIAANRWEAAGSDFHSAEILFLTVSLWMVFLMLGTLVAAWWASLMCCSIADSELTCQPRSVRQAAKTVMPGFKSLALLMVIISIGFGLLTWGVLAWYTYIVGSLGPDTSIWTSITLSMGVLFVLGLIAMVVSYYLSVKWFVAFPAIIGEKVGIWKALSRSWQITKGSSGMILIIVIVTTIVLGTLSQIIAVPAGLMSLPVWFVGNSPMATIMVSMVLTVILSFAFVMVTLPITPILSQVVYRDRIACGQK